MTKQKGKGMKTNSPLVTIVTPSFNQADFLEATICSVLEQDYPNIEYHVVDGGSTDDSLKIIRKYAERISWWVSEEDSGQAEAINKGLKRAKGEFVGWLNSDDIYQPGAISSAVEAFRSNPQAGVIYGDAWSIDSQGTAFNIMRAGQYSLVDLLAFSSICQPAAFMRSSILEKAGYLDLAYHHVLDHYLWIRMAQLAPLVHVPKIWASARYHEQAKNRKSSEGFSIEAMQLMGKLQNDVQYSKVIADHSRYIYSGVNRYRAFYLTDSGKPWQALQLYFKSFLLHPATALRDWRHIILAGLSLVGLQNIRKPYDNARARKLE
jgi:glycosyltransferase involved in cell wall biosynthesis